MRRKKPRKRINHPKKTPASKLETLNALRLLSMKKDAVANSAIKRARLKPTRTNIVSVLKELRALRRIYSKRRKLLLELVETQSVKLIGLTSDAVKEEIFALNFAIGVCDGEILQWQQKLSKRKKRKR